MLIAYKLKLSLLRFTNNQTYNTLVNNYFIIAVFILIFLFTINNFIFGLILIIFSVFLYKKSKTLLCTSIIISLLILTNYFIVTTKPRLKTGEICGRIDFIDQLEYSNRLTVRASTGKVYVYDYQYRKLEIGMEVEVIGEVIKVREKRVEGEFNYGRYLKQNNFIGSIKAETINVIGRKYSPSWFIQKINDYFSNTFKDSSLVFMRALLLGDDSSFDEDFKESLIINGTLHLFAISGSHISLFVLYIGTLLNYYFKNKKSIEFIICLFLLFYMVITLFSPSIVRASLMYYLIIINKRFNLKLTTMDIVSIVFIFLIILNPFYMYNIGFILSFIISFFIILISPIIKDKSFIYQSLVISSLAQVITLPIIVNLNYQVNILSPLINIISIFIVEGVILPLTIFIFLVPILQPLYKLIIDGFVNISLLSSQVFNIPLKLSYFNGIMIFIYYGLLILVCNKRHYKRTIVILCVFLLCIANIRVFNTMGRIYYMDLENGEAIIILEPHNRCNMVIDTGDGSGNIVSNFLKRCGVKELDALVLTHNHSDHNGEAKELLNQFSINKIYVHAYDNSDIARHANVTRLSRGDRISIGRLEFYVLNPSQNSTNENDNSLVLYGEIGGLKHLFLGDASVDIEMSFSDLKVDVLKVGHHGSKTSSSSAFIQKLKPKYAIIQTGHIEKFGFPHQEVIDNLRIVEKVYRTDKNGSITFKYYKNSSIYKVLR